MKTLLIFQRRLKNLRHKNFESKDLVLLFTFWGQPSLLLFADLLLFCVQPSALRKPLCLSQQQRYQQHNPLQLPRYQQHRIQQLAAFRMCNLWLVEPFLQQQQTFPEYVLRVRHQPCIWLPIKKRFGQQSIKHNITLHFASAASIAARCSSSALRYSALRFAPAFCAASSSFACSDILKNHQTPTKTD